MPDGKLTFDTKINKQGFEKGVKSLDSSLVSLQGQLKRLAKVAAAAFSVRQIVNFAKESKSLYDVQLEQETKLIAIMRQRMAATDDQIDSIKKLAAEQQNLGVIGDEVQLAGAQQIATFATETSTIETLIPAMNNLLAQQNGLNASASDAVNIGNLIGKVLQGQTSALKRVGISFSDAEEQVLKYGTESQKAAMLAKVITNNVGNMNAALAQTDAGKQKQLANAMGDVKEQFGQAVYTIESAFLPLISKLVQGFAEIATMAQRVSLAIREAFGVDSSENSATIAAATAQATAATAASYEDIEDSAENTQKAQKKSLASFDKINTISANTNNNATSAGSSSPTLTPTVEVKDNTSLVGKKLESFVNKTRKLFNSFLKYFNKNFSPSFKKVWTKLSPQIVRFGETCEKIFGDIKKLGPPLLDYFNNSFTPMLQTFIETAGDILAGLFDSFNTVFSDIWNVAAYPILESFIVDGLPMITEFCEEAILTYGTLFDEVKKGFDMIWKDAAVPALEGISKAWQDTMKILSEFWNKHGKAVFEKFRTAIKTTGDTLSNVWKTIFKPVFDKLMSVMDELWDNHAKPLLKNFLDFAGTLARIALDIYNNFIAPLVNWFVDTFGPSISKVLQGLLENFGNKIGGIMDILNSFFILLKDILSFLTNVFKGNWSDAWKDIKKIFKDVWDSFISIAKYPLNQIIDLINLFLKGVETALQACVNALNKISVDIPSWSPIGAGSTLGFHLPDVHIEPIKGLAQGTVIPANFGNFLAMLGDNKREAEVVSPLSTIEKAVENALARMGGGGDQTIHVHVDLDGREIGKVAVKAVRDDNARKGVA